MRIITDKKKKMLKVEILRAWNRKIPFRFSRLINLDLLFPFLSSFSFLINQRILLFCPQFWSAYVPCESQHLNAVQLTLEQVDLIKRLIEKYSQHLQFAASSRGEYLSWLLKTCIYESCFYDSLSFFFSKKRKFIVKNNPFPSFILIDKK